MSFKESLPGTSNSVAQPAIKTVTANRNPNRTPHQTQSPEETDADKKETNEELLARFKELHAEQYSNSSSSYQQFLKNQQQQAQLAGLNPGAGAGQIPSPSIPNFGGGGGAKAGGASKPSASSSNPTNQANKKPESELDKPDLVKNEKDKERISPLQRPGGTGSNPDKEAKEAPDSSQAQNSTAQANNSPSKKENDFNLTNALIFDADRIAEQRGLSQDNSRIQSQNIAKGYLDAEAEHSLTKSEIRRLAFHDIPYNEKHFDAKNNPEQNDRLVNGLISAKNESSIAKLSQGEDIARHYKEQGFTRGDYSQLTARQFSDSFKDLTQSISQRNDFLVGPKSMEDIAKEEARIDKQVLVLLPEKGATEFDMTREIADLKKLGYSVFVAQLNGDDSLKLFNEDGSKTPIKKLADDVGGFGKLVFGGHGEGSGTAAIRFGDKANLSDPNNFAQAEKSYLDASDAGDLKDFLSVLKDGGQVLGCSCSFVGSSSERENYIKAEESIAALIKELRPDLDVQGAFDDVHANGRFAHDSNDKLTHSTMRRLDEPELTNDQIAQQEIKEPEPVDSVDNLLASLDIDFDDDEYMS